MNLKFPSRPQLQAQGHRSGWGLTPALLAVPLCFWGPLLTPAQAQNAGAVLKAVQQSEAKIEYSATQVVQRGSSREVAKIYRDGIKKRLEWVAPDVKKGDVLVDDGTTVTLYHHADKTAIQTQSQHRVPAFNSGDWKVGAPVKQGGVLVRVLSRADGRKLTVDAGTKAIVKMQGQRGVTILESIDYGPIAASKFVFALPAGAKLTRVNGQLFNDLRGARKKADWFKAPSQLPSGYNFESAIVGPSEVWLRYTNGRQRFSIFQQKADGGDIAPQKVDGGWFWKSGGLRFLASDAPEAAVPNLASSLK